MSQPISNAALCLNAQNILKELGYEIKRGHVYELFSKLNGQPSWNHANAKNVRLVEVVESSSVSDPAHEIQVNNAPENKGFDIKVVCGMHGTIEIKKYYRVWTTSQWLATTIIQCYLKAIEDDTLEFEGVEAEYVNRLMHEEGPDKFKSENWEVIWNEAVPQIDSYYPATPSSLWDFSVHRFENRAKNYDMNGKLIEDQGGKSQAWIAQTAMEDLMDWQERYGRIIHVERTPESIKHLGDDFRSYPLSELKDYLIYKWTNYFAK